VQRQVLYRIRLYGGITLGPLTVDSRFHALPTNGSVSDQADSVIHVRAALEADEHHERGEVAAGLGEVAPSAWLGSGLACRSSRGATTLGIPL
jgi:hypothetical protein